MSNNLWPSERPSTTRAAKARPGTAVPTDWFSGWLVTLFTLALVAIAIAFIAPVAASAFEAFQTVTDTLELASRNTKL